LDISGGSGPLTSPLSALDGRRAHPEVETMQMYIALQPLVALIAGILILMIPRLLNYIVAIYLIVTGILSLLKM
jgi:hypothetical protein